MENGALYDRYSLRTRRIGHLAVGARSKFGDFYYVRIEASGQKLTRVQRPRSVHLAEIEDVSSINRGICGALMSLWVAALTLNELSSAII